MKKFIPLLLFVLACFSVPSFAQSSVQTAGTITTTCANAKTSCAGTAGSSVETSSTNYSNVTVTINGAYTGLTIFFEFSDDGGTTYYSEGCAEAAAPATIDSTKVVSDNSNLGWYCNIPGTVRLRIRASAITGGTVNVKMTTAARG
jgi:hypothetical protein